MCANFSVFAQKENNDSSKVNFLEEVVISANKLPMVLKKIPKSISYIDTSILSEMPKTIAVNEALRLVPGVRIDNQHDGERVHMSIRGQGILTERGLRGISVLIDGIPVNDPSGFAMDLYDVDWATVENIELLRGSAASLYGGSGAAGVLNINTANGGKKPFGGMILQTLGTNGFMKSLAQFNGKSANMDYRISFSHIRGNGNRNHQAFWGNILYEKINFYPTRKIKITQILSHSDYFNQNPEGLNLQQLNNPLQANPDACPFNEYQKTNRTTIGLVGKYKISERQDIDLTVYMRPWRYKETGNRAAEYRNYNSPGTNFQYNLYLGNEKIKNNFSIGSEFKWQNIGIYKLQSAADPNRVESIDETNLETDTLLANQIILQNSIGTFGIYQLTIGKFNFLASIRYDKMNNQLTDRMMATDTATTNKDFYQLSSSVGISYNFKNELTGFVNWSQGFMPPSTEELAANPVAYYGFNTHLVPATSTCSEIGFRGFIKDKFHYEITGFIMNTENDFFRFKQTGRGNQEVFYGNAGNSNRKGIELYSDIAFSEKIKLRLAYTFSDFKYTSATIDPVYTDTVYVLTTPPASGQWLPNSPRHQLYSELTYLINKKIKINFACEYQSKWAIYTDANVYAGKMNPTIYQNWQDGFMLFHAGITYQWKLNNVTGECSIFAKNLTDELYMAFTEPDPDGNSYQPGPGREIFGNIKIKF